ncbi:FAD dependent oxidoreductase [Apiospora hydei]|uniref:FAD dependent oxidoreductase n=1 Tax=Apiospora hydei TaxID=1337664 RepID=A0ABR1WZ34_9PEZI
MSQAPDPSAFSANALLDAMDHDHPVPSPAQFPQTAEDARYYWIDNFPIELDTRFADAAPPAEADVAIIGSGITGAVAAYRLAQERPDLRVAVLEARGLSSGATGRSGGHIGRPEVFDYRALAATFGAADALRIRCLMLKSRDMLLECLDRLGAADRVDLRLDGTIVVFADDEERRKFRDDLAYAREQGYKAECCTLTPEDVLKYGASYLAKSGTIYPRKLVSVLFEAALERMPSSLSLHPHTPVTSVTKTMEGSSPRYVVTTDTGRTLKAKVVLHATNGYASHLVPSLRGKRGVVGCMAHMLGVQPPPSTQAAAAPQLNLGFGYADFWHWIQQRPQGGPFLYGLATAESMNKYDDCATLPDDHAVRQEMYQFLQKTFGTWFPGGNVGQYVKYDWTGIQGFTADGASIVGRPIKNSPGEFASVGHNGEGMTRCFACSSVVADMVLAYLRGDEDLSVPEWFPRAFLRDEVARPSEERREEGATTT